MNQAEITTQIVNFIKSNPIPFIPPFVALAWYFIRQSMQKGSVTKDTINASLNAAKSELEHGKLLE